MKPIHWVAVGLMFVASVAAPVLIEWWANRDYYRRRRNRSVPSKEIK